MKAIAIKIENNTQYAKESFSTFRLILCCHLTYSVVQKVKYCKSILDDHSNKSYDYYNN